MKFSFKKIVAIITIITTVIVVFLPVITWYVKEKDASWEEGNMANTPYAVEQYSNDVSIGEDGKILSGKTAQEMWDEMLENGSRVDKYLNNPEELQKLINAERVTDFIDTRKKEDLDKSIDWNSINKDVNTTEVQGIVKLKRASDDGSISNLVYTDSETFHKYINQYNDTGSESDRKKALSYFTLEKQFKTSNLSNAGIIYGTGEFKKFELTEHQLKAIATVCQAEQGSAKGAAAEASLMANHMDLNTSTAGNYPDTGEGLYNYIKESPWFATASKEKMDSYIAHGTPLKEDVLEAVRAVLVNGMRTLPGYIDEHDCFSDISSASNNGQAISVGSRSQYVQHVTKINNTHGGKYIFYNFPESNSDPFGYTSQANREKIGDFYYEYETGNEVNKKNTEEENDSDTNKENLPDVLCWPTESTNVTSPFGMRIHPVYNEPKMHRGIDIGVPTGKEIYATEAGTVTLSGYSSTAGEWIWIDHGNGYITKYMHNSERKVKKGDVVAKGQVIALAGSTGTSTGSHLHFQIEYNGEPVDPLSFKYNNGMGGGVGGIGSDTTTLSTTSSFYIRVATWSESTDIKEVNDVEVSRNTNYTMTSTKINYQDLISGYKMPFDYLWALLVISEEKEFVFELADLVYNSEIEITVHDNLTINTNVSTETYKEKTKVITDDIKLTVSYDKPDSSDPSVTSKFYDTETGGPLETELETQYKEVNTLITKNNTLDVKVTKADVWIVKYEPEFTLEIRPAVNTPTDIPYKDEEYPENPNQTVYNDPAGLAIGFRNDKYNELAELYTNVNVGLSYSKTDLYTKKVERKIHIDNSLKKTEYIETPAEPIEKTDKTSTEPNFVTIILKYKNARGRIISGSSWLFEILESGPNTTNPDMAELTKYLLYKATNISFDGVENFDFSIYDPKYFNIIGGDEGGLSLTTTMFTKEIFKQALQAYYEKTKNENFYNNFLVKADELYDSSISNNVNPELVVITARGEGNFKEAGGRYNYWGIGVPNGASAGYSYNSLSEGIAGYANTLKKYVSGSYASMIMERYEERKAAGCDPLGYGKPGTLSGMQSIYSYLGKHEYGSSGTGGYYYMDPDRAGVTKIYSTHAEFLAKCKNSGLSEHASGTETTVWEQGQYTAWQVESKLEYWDEIFGSFGSRMGNGANQSIVNIAKTKIGCPYVYGAKGPNSFDCSGFVYWCYKQSGIIVPSSTDGYKKHIGTNKEISWSQAQPGDILIVTDTERGTKDGHAAIYLGNDSYIHAPTTGKTVTIVESGATTKFRHVFRFN